MTEPPLPVMAGLGNAATIEALIPGGIDVDRYGALPAMARLPRAISQERMLLSDSSILRRSLAAGDGLHKAGHDDLDASMATPAVLGFGRPLAPIR